MTTATISATKTRTIKLIADSGDEVDSFELRADRSLPDVVVWGIGDRQRVFVRDGKVYRQATFVTAPMPEFIPL
jgi:hypothetical protein